jgi:hypothetical protein
MMSSFIDNLQAFVKAFAPTSPTDIVLAIGYIFENYRAMQQFSVADLREGFLEARLPLPTNLYDVVTKTAKQRLLICDRKSKPFRYQLSSYGIDKVENRLQSLGLLERGEESNLITEISTTLNNSLTKIPDLDERGYIQEALSCVSHHIRAYRAAVLLAWAGVIYHLRKKVQAQGFDKFCQAYEELSLGKPKHVSDIDDLEFCGDKDFLLVLERMGIIADKAIRQQLENCLDLRNACAHPTQVAPKIHRLRAFFEDIIEYALSR